PFGPMRATAAPGSTTPVTPSSTGSRPYAAATRSRTRAGLISSKVGDDLLRVVLHHLEVGVGVAAGRAERVAVERIGPVEHRDGGLRCDGLGRFGGQRALGEGGLHPLVLDLGDEVVDVAGRQLGLRVEARDDRADEVEAVMLDVVA